MSQVDPKEQGINRCWSRIMSHSRSLSNLDNNGNKWCSLLIYVPLNNLLSNKTDWQAQLVSYYCRLTEYEPSERQKSNYRELLKAINEMVGLLNN